MGKSWLTPKSYGTNARSRKRKLMRQLKAYTWWPMRYAVLTLSTRTLFFFSRSFIYLSIHLKALERSLRLHCVARVCHFSDFLISQCFSFISTASHRTRSSGLSTTSIDFKIIVNIMFDSAHNTWWAQHMRNVAVNIVTINTKSSTAKWPFLLVASNQFSVMCWCVLFVSWMQWHFTLLYILCFSSALRYRWNR